MFNDVKNLCRKAINATAQCRPVYEAFWHPLIRCCNLAQREHLWESLEVSESEMQEARELLAPQIVRSGPFRGLKYPNAQAAGSSIYPKLIGSYERELHPAITNALDAGYSDVVDIGCAEGYYAVGFAQRIPSAHIWAFDTDSAALGMCREMAVLNEVQGRVSVAGLCDSKTLCELPFKGKALIFSDCEGFEQMLFSPHVCNVLAAHDLIIEIHDFIRPFISFDLKSRLRATHHVDRIRTIPDFVRPDVYQYPELDDFSPATRIALLAEYRPSEMEWFVCHSKKCE